MIRPATLQDMPELLRMGEAMHQESPRWSRLSYSHDKVSASLRAWIGSASGLVIVAELAGNIVGGIVAHALPAWCSDDIVVDEVSFYMKPEHRGSVSAARLVCCFKEWAHLQGAAWAYAGASTGVSDEMVAQLYEAFGFTRCAIGLEVYFGN